MKKLVLIGLLGLVIATAGAFAEHPAGWSLGVGAQYGAGWDTPDEGGYRWSLYVKAPSLPIYWSVNMDLDSGNNYSAFNLNLNGDYYLIDRALIPDIGLGWFLGLGGYLRFYHYGSDHANMSYNGLGAGARLPIGLSWQPVDFLEIFADIAPSVGFLSYFGDAAPDKFSFPDGGWQGDIAVRFWF